MNCLSHSLPQVLITPFFRWSTGFQPARQFTVWMLGSLIIQVLANLLSGRPFSKSNHQKYQTVSPNSWLSNPPGCFQKWGDFTPKMDGENNGKPPKKDPWIWGVIKTTIFGEPPPHFLQQLTPRQLQQKSRDCPGLMVASPPGVIL